MFLTAHCFESFLCEVTLTHNLLFFFFSLRNRWCLATNTDSVGDYKGKAASAKWSHSASVIYIQSFDPIWAQNIV